MVREGFQHQSWDIVGGRLELGGLPPYLAQEKGLVPGANVSSLLLSASAIRPDLRAPTIRPTFLASAIKPDLPFPDLCHSDATVLFWGVLSWKASGCRGLYPNLIHCFSLTYHSPRQAISLRDVGLTSLVFALRIEGGQTVVL